MTRMELEEGGSWRRSPALQWQWLLMRHRAWKLLCVPDRTWWAVMLWLARAGGAELRIKGVE
jgi:hypothetical protein